MLIIPSVSKKNPSQVPISDFKHKNKLVNWEAQLKLLRKEKNDEELISHYWPGASLWLKSNLIMNLDLTPAKLMKKSFFKEITENKILYTLFLKKCNSSNSANAADLDQLARPQSLLARIFYFRYAKKNNQLNPELEKEILNSPYKKIRQILDNPTANLIKVTPKELPHLQLNQTG